MVAESDTYHAPPKRLTSSYKGVEYGKNLEPPTRQRFVPKASYLNDIHPACFPPVGS